MTGALSATGTLAVRALLDAGQRFVDVLQQALLVLHERDILVEALGCRVGQVRRHVRLALRVNFVDDRFLQVVDGMHKASPHSHQYLSILFQIARFHCYQLSKCKMPAVASRKTQPCPQETEGEPNGAVE